MVSEHLNLPFRRDVIKRVLSEQVGRGTGLPLIFCGAVAELMGLKTQHAQIPSSAIARIQGPALIPWEGGFAVLYETNTKEITLGVPEVGIIRPSPEEFQAQWGEKGEVLMLEVAKETPQQKFGLQWFVPSLRRYRMVLAVVLLASFFVQLFGLANPLMIQVIIDKVITQNSTDTLQVLGLFLVVVAIFEALLSSLRTYLFVDTTNRIDLALGAEIIDHLFRLPLRYFEKRPVGELSSRVNELENIRQFLTGTALTVVLDSVFSVIYIVVMFVYSWKLTLVALGSIPLFIGVTLIFSPIVRRLLRKKAENYARTQSYLVEALSGIQTVKAQNIELKARWQWQDRYARYVSAGFKTVLTNTIASSTSDFLNKLSALLVLWVGAVLVLNQDITLGQLIAFRIISGYVTGPLLRLAQLWQNFQETALSLERLSDIIDTPQEESEEERNNILMPLVKGNIRYENVSFRFGASGPLQLTNISVDIPAGKFVGIVGQSGSGKSTLTKLLPRLYHPASGRILIDDYDVNKVELYSLRRQVGIVPQDSLLFEGTIQDNIALTRPDASSEAIIEAAQIACAHDFIMDMPQAYNSSVGERGSNLSGGQRQRIAIARTILQNPRLLILDEATSALDYDTERQVSLNMMEALRGRTVLFITHRLTTVQNADLILVMDKGSIVEQGSHEELMAERGRYYALFQQQDRSA
ncbi:MAG: peptidase domain-containing ABC transporter [Synechococcales cyanobacterium CRU_2_2]|nr:peptidase domain-containing ABC transporter [Synechococcales cyanobacterium CRU_2_2]